MHDSTQPFDVRQETAERGAVRVVVSGELDLATVGLLEDRLTQLTDAGHIVELVLSELSFIDATGLNAVIYWVQETGTHGRSIRVDRRVSRCVRRILELSGAEDHVWPPGDPVAPGVALGCSPERQIANGAPIAPAAQECRDRALRPRTRPADGMGERGRGSRRRGRRKSADRT